MEKKTSDLARASSTRVDNTQPRDGHDADETNETTTPTMTNETTTTMT